jgi:hypothetical protein
MNQFKFSGLFRRFVFAGLYVVGVALATASPARAGTDFSFTGSFNQDDEVQLFNFSVGLESTVTLKTLSYAGGTNAAGQVISRGGFDPILALFDSTGALIDQNDDGTFPNVAVDSVTGVTYDTFLEAVLSPGAYTVAVSQYDNFANGPNLSNGFEREGEGNFRSGFFDVTGDQRTGAWAFDVLNVDFATDGGEVPEPASAAIFAVLGLAVITRRRR